ncbi:MAG TPA: helix-turn-helix domain-containing protein [Tissierellaceae bacterium]
MARYHCTTKRCSFKHLNVYKREEIAALYRESKNIRYFIKELAQAPSTIRKGIKRGTVT